MSFMQPQIELGEWYQVETNYGTETVPADLIDLPLKLDETATTDNHGLAHMAEALRDYLEGTQVREITRIKGYGARLSAHGYMDCTEWNVFETEQAAKDYLDEMYGDDDPYVQE
jgi:hypothetical protein